MMVLLIFFMFCSGEVLVDKLVVLCCVGVIGLGCC